MKIQCPTCRMIIEDDKIQRCPRCHTVLKKFTSCAGCKGCSLQGLCHNKK